MAVINWTTSTTTGTGDVANIDAVTFAEIKTVIEADILPAVTVTQNDNLTIKITSNTTGATSTVSVVSGNARTILGLSVEVGTGADAVGGARAIPTAGSDNDALGLVWQYIYQGKLYTCMVESASVLSDYAIRVFGDTDATAGEILFTALDAGLAGEAVKIKFVDDVAAAAETASVSGSVVTIHFENGVSTVNQVKTAYNATTADTTLASVSTQNGGALTIPAAQLEARKALQLAGVLDHSDLTGDEMPSVVETRFQDAVAVEFREVNFAHQLASFCHTASATWKVMLGVIPTIGPDAYSSRGVREWLGSLPTYTEKGLQLCIDVAGDNGVGVLGNKFLAGVAGYRDQMVLDGDSGDGLAYGGFILTEGDSLPNGSEFSYGILESDELLDTGKKPVDIGKYVLVTYDRPIHNNAYNSGSSYRGHLAASLAGKIAITPENREPIGTAGLMTKIAHAPKIHAVQMDQLSLIRTTGLRKEDGGGHILVDVKTVAHPDSDYTLLSTIRCVNRELQGIREIGKRYLGKPFSPEVTSSLSSAIEQFMQSEKLLGFNQGYKHTIRYSRGDRILGRLKIKLRMIPPFSIKAIEVEISLAADESEL